LFFNFQKKVLELQVSEVDLGELDYNFPLCESNLLFGSEVSYQQ